MAVFSTLGMEFDMLAGGATPTPIIATAATKAKPCEITVADTTGLVEGALLWLPTKATGLSQVDGKWWIATNVSATTFELLGSNTAASTDVFFAGPAIDFYVNADMVRLCPATVTINAGDVTTIEAGTFCDPSQQIAGSVTAGTVDYTGFTDTADEGYVELTAADEDGLARRIRVKSAAGGYYLSGGVITNLIPSWEINAAEGWAFTHTLETKIRHLF